MTDQGTKAIDDLLSGLRDADFQVVNLGTRYRVTNPAGGAPAFIPARIPKNGKLTHILRELLAVGFDEDVVAAARERKRKERMDADRAKGERLANEAAAKAAANGTGHHRAAAAAAVASFNRETDLARRPANSEPVRSESAAAVRAEVAAAARTTPVPERPAVDEPRVTIVDMTPKLAAELLEHNHWYDPGRKADEGITNRKFSQEKADEYRDAMLRGEWDLTHQGLGFDRALKLLDGQHRLVAVVLAGEINPAFSVKMMVTYDLDPEVSQRIDIGKRRTLADILSMHGETYTASLAAASRLVTAYDEVPYSPSAWRKHQLTPTQQLDFVAAEPKIRDAVALAAQGNQKLLLPSAGGAAWHIIGRHYGLGELEVIQDKLSTGTGLEEGDPWWALREAFIRIATAKHAVRDPVHQLACLIKAWNAHKAGQRRTLLRWSVNEDFPRVKV